MRYQLAGVKGNKFKSKKNLIKLFLSMTNPQVYIIKINQHLFFTYPMQV